MHDTPAITLTAIPAEGSAPVPHPLQLDADGGCHFRLACLPGATAVHLTIALDGQPRLRAEVRAQAGEVIRCTLRLDDAGEPVLDAGRRQVFFLPLEPAADPLPPLPPPAGEDGWDIGLLIDATTRTAADPADPGDATAPDAFLLDQPEQWRAVVAPVLELVRRLGQGCRGARYAIIAFGDEPPPAGVHASDLRPAFHLRHLPEERPQHALLAMTPEDLAEVLRNDPRPSPGGDFVDALADGLAEAAALQWGDERRRLLIVIGDSPGHAAADPVPWGGDGLARRADVDTETARLHRDHRVEVLTLYHPPPVAWERTLLDAQAALIRYARGQYRRLAATPALAFTTTDFDPAQAAAALLERREPLGRGPCWGRLEPTKGTSN